MEKQVIVAGGCFWGVQEYYSRIKGIIDTEVGYSQGRVEHPQYQDVKKQITDHAEVVKLTYDEQQIAFEQILDHLFRIIDPTSYHKQGGDEGSSYRCGVYTYNLEDYEKAKKYIGQKQECYTEPIYVECELVHDYYLAEEYHQNYLKIHVNGYCHVDFSKIKPDEYKDKTHE